MWPKVLFFIFLILLPVAIVVAQEDGPEHPDDPNLNVGKQVVPVDTGDAPAKMVSGMSVLGNKEAPMSLFIVPWKTSELGAEASLARTLDERREPVDREVFRREIAFYEASVGESAKAAVPAN